MDDVDADGDAPPLPAGDAAVALVAYDGLCRVPQTQLFDQGLDSLQLLSLGKGARQPEFGSEREGLLHGEHREEEVVLHDVRGDGLHQPPVERLAVESHRPLQAPLRDSARQRVDQRRLPRPARPQHSQYLAIPRLPRNPVQQRLRLRKLADVLAGVRPRQRGGPPAGERPRDRHRPAGPDAVCEVGEAQDEG
uniref:Uncharacterized protein n=1 Tax=Nymphaea colorata TaxID=210225 RepID=A0A5K1DRZ7_9MAGN